MALALKTRGFTRHWIDDFFPAEPVDIYNESIFPHEWNYGLPDFPLPKHLSVSGPPREGELDFEYYERAYPLVRPLKPSTRKRRLPRSHRPWLKKYPAIEFNAKLSREYKAKLSHSRPERRVPILSTGDEPVNFPPPRPPIQKVWHYIWQTKKVLACTGKGCSLCWP